MSLAIAVLLISAFLFGLGFRGQRLGFHPVCRKCGYDLSGKPEGVDVCSECGADLNRASAIRIGQRRRYWGAILFASTLAIPSGAWIGSSRVRGLATRDWEPAKPTFWMIHDLQSRDTVLAQRATDELARRLNAGRLSNANVARVAAILLELQPGTPPSNFDDIIATARERGQLDDEQWQQYWRQAFPLQLHATRTSRPFDAVELSLSTDERSWRCQQLSAFDLDATGEFLRIGAQQIDVSDLRLSRAIRREGGGGLLSWHFVPLVSSSRGDSMDRWVLLSVRLELRISDPIPGRPKLIAQIPLDLSTTFKLPADKSFLVTQSGQ